MQKLPPPILIALSQQIDALPLNERLALLDYLRTLHEMQQAQQKEQQNKQLSKIPPPDVYFIQN